MNRKRIFTLKKCVEVCRKLKNPFWRAKCNYVKYFEKLPIEEKTVLLESQGATKLSGNMFYMIKYMTSCDKYQEYKLYLSAWDRYVNEMRSMLERYHITGVKIVVYSSDEYVRLLASAKYLINDNTFPQFYIKKTGQIYLNTWHGTPLKTLGRKIQNDIAIGNTQKNFVVSDYLLYPNEFTRDVIIRDYMLENIAHGFYIMGGYPRNEIFFDRAASERIKVELGLVDKRIYAFMPTWRGNLANVGSEKNNAYLMHLLYEIDKGLNDDEIMYVNFHPLTVHRKNEVEVESFKHVKRFPESYETYDFLNIAHVLVTDFSSVFFDFACTRRKIVLFPYDKEEYLSDRGTYIDMDILPFPQVFDVISLIGELRSPKKYDDTEFVKYYNPFDGIDASRKLCDFFILEESTGIAPIRIPDNEKENVLIYAGSLNKNGITTSLRSLMNTIDLDKRNYYISFYHQKAGKHIAQLMGFNGRINYFPVAGFSDLTVFDRVMRELFRKKLISAETYIKKMGKRIDEDFWRSYGTDRFDIAVQFCGYEDEVILLYSRFEGKKAIFVHNNMISEIDIKHNQRKDVLKYAYNVFDKVAVVTDEIIPSTEKISGRTDNIITVRNTIDYKAILMRSNDGIRLDADTKCSVDPGVFYEIINSKCKKFINIGRFSAEKGHDRLVDAFYRVWGTNPDTVLIIIGGYNNESIYEKMCAKICELGLKENVILLLSVSNPYPILKACDYLVLSSFYEGVPMVLAEADVLGKPVVSTDIPGPRSFMKRYGGTLVENSKEGIYQGMKLLLEGKTNLMDIDYEVYNAECVEEFERLFD